MKRLATIIMAIVVFACGGGGSDSGVPAGNSYVGFTTADFSGKSLYYVSGVGPSYQLGAFYPDGTARASAMVTSGAPTLQQDVASWSIVDGQLIISVPGDTVRYKLLSDDTQNRYMRANKYSANGNVSVVGMFYDQNTALVQAQNFVANHMTP